MATHLRVERYPVAPDSVEEFEALAGGYVAEARAHPGSLWADLARAADDDPSFLVLSEWRTAADLDAFSAGPSAAAFEDEAAIMLRGEPTSRRFEALK